MSDFVGKERARDEMFGQDTLNASSSTNMSPKRSRMGNVLSIGPDGLSRGASTHVQDYNT